MARPSHSQSLLRRWFKPTVRLLVLSPSIIVAICLMAWLAGRFVSDRYFWSQWLLWIPTQAAIAGAIVGLALAFTWRRKRRMYFAWSACLAGVLVYFCFIEYRMFAGVSDQPQGVRIVHWNATQEGGTGDDYIDALIDAGGDITITTDAGTIPFRPRTWLWNGGSPASMRPFAIATKLPILTMRSLANEDEIIVVLVEIDTTEMIGRPLVLYVVDMPSDLNLARADLARRARRMIDNANAPPPDVVVGDFNIVRGAASLRMMFPGMTHAYDQAGRGYSATFHRGKGGWLMYHIDHILLSDAFRATSYEIIDPGVGRHNMQAATIMPAQ